MTPEIRTKRLPALLLVLLTIACAGLGWSGVRCGLPHVQNADEWIYLAQYRHIRGEPLISQAYPRANAYPNLWIRAAAWLPRTRPASAPTTVAEHIEAATSDLVFLRRCAALLASLVVPATWFLARRFLSSGWSLATAALAGWTVLHASFASQARPHAFAAAAIVFAVAAAVDVVRFGTLRASVVAGLATSLAVALLQNGIAVCPALAFAHLLRVRSDGWRAIQNLAMASAIVGATVVAAYPGMLIDRLFPGADPAFRPSFFAPHLVTTDDFVGGGAPIVLRAFWFHDPLLGAVCVASIVAFAAAWVLRRKPLARRGRELLVVLAFVIPFGAALIAFGHTYYRFALPLFPFAALFAMLGLGALRKAGVVLAGLLLAFQLASVVQLARVRLAPDTCELAAEWISTHADRATARIAIMPSSDLPLLRTAAALASENNSSPGVYARWIDYQRTVEAAELDALGWSIVDLPLRRQKHRAALVEDPAAYARELDADYVIIEVFEPGTRDILARVRAAVGTAGTVVATFVPEGEGARDPHSLDPFCGAEAFPRERLAWRLFGAEALGPHLEIWRIRR
jgi:hypothetical protein